MIWFSKNKRTGRPSGVLLISSGGLGDTVLFSFVVNRFRALAKPGEAVSLLMPKESLKLSFLFDQEIKLIGIDHKKYRKKLSYGRETNKNLYDSNFRLVVTTDFLRHPKIDEAMIKSCDAKEVVGMEARSWPKYDKALTRNKNLYSRLFDSGPLHLDKVLRWAKFADWLTGEDAPPPVLMIPEEKVPPSNRFLKPTVALVPFSAVKEKQAAPEMFSRIIEHLRGDYEFLVVATKSDMESNKKYATIFRASDIKIDISSFEDLVPKLKASNLVISVDTAVMHLAACLGVPTICIASAAYVNEIVPYSTEISPKNVRFVYKAMHCEGCLGSCQLTLESGRFPCVARLDIVDVVKCIDEILDYKVIENI